MRRIWRQKWFILVVVVFLFFAVSYTKVALAGTDVELDKILKAGVDGLTEFFKFLINVLNKIW